MQQHSSSSPPLPSPPFPSTAKTVESVTREADLNEQMAKLLIVEQQSLLTEIQKVIAEIRLSSSSPSAKQDNKPTTAKTAPKENNKKANVDMSKKPKEDDKAKCKDNKKANSPSQDKISTAASDTAATTASTITAAAAPKSKANEVLINRIDAAAPLSLSPSSHLRPAIHVPISSALLNFIAYVGQIWSTHVFIHSTALTSTGDDSTGLKKLEEWKALASPQGETGLDVILKGEGESALFLNSNSDPIKDDKTIVDQLIQSIRQLNINVDESKVNEFKAKL